MQVAITGPIEGTDRERVRIFLRSEGYAQPVPADNQVFAAWMDSEVVGAVRLAAEQGVTVLRGMRVRSDLRRRGIGRKLLSHVDQVLGSTTCYCLPYAWLTTFYGGMGFTVIDGQEAPAFLVDRHSRYTERGLNVVIMVRR